MVFLFFLPTLGDLDFNFFFRDIMLIFFFVFPARFAALVPMLFPLNIGDDFFFADRFGAVRFTFLVENFFRGRTTPSSLGE